MSDWGQTVTSIKAMFTKRLRKESKSTDVAGAPSRDEMLEKIREHRMNKVANKNVPRSVVSKPWTF